MAKTARKLLGNPMPQYLNAITIATNQAIADTGATSIFIMDGVEVENRRITKKPLIISLPDGRKVRLTHECDINMPGLPCTLTGHIVPTLAVASLIGIRPLCKAGCKVIFDDKKCEVVYKEKVILRGFKDASTDLWMLPIPTKRNGNHPRTCNQRYKIYPATTQPLLKLCPASPSRRSVQPGNVHTLRENTGK